MFYRDGKTVILDLPYLNLIIKHLQLLVVGLREQVLIDEVDFGLSILLARQDLVICQCAHDINALLPLELMLE